VGRSKDKKTLYDVGQWDGDDGSGQRDPRESKKVKTDFSDLKIEYRYASSSGGCSNKSSSRFRLVLGNSSICR